MINPMMDDIRVPNPSKTAARGTGGVYSGYVCGGCNRPLALGSMNCATCGRHFPYPTQMHPQQPAPARDDRPSHVYDPLSSRYVPRVRHEKQQEQFGKFVLVASVIMLIVVLFFVFGH